jgi:hypothetical protein
MSNLRWNVVAVIIAIAALFLIALAKNSATRRSVLAHQCRLNQKNLWVLYRDFFENHGKRTITEVSTNQGGTLEFRDDPRSAYHHFGGLLSFPGALLGNLICPTDTRRPARDLQHLGNLNLSYFLAIDPQPLPNSIIIGDRNVGPSSSITNISPTEPLVWRPDLGLHGAAGYIAFFDGRVEYRKLRVPAETNNVIVIP